MVLGTRTVGLREQIIRQVRLWYMVRLFELASVAGALQRATIA